MNISDKPRKNYITVKPDNNQHPSPRQISYHSRTSKKDDNYSVRIGQNTQEIKAMKDSLSEYQAYPVSDIDYLVAELAWQKDEIKPYVILLTHNSRVELILFGKIEQKELEFKIGKKVVFKNKMRSLSVVNESIFGDLSPANCEILQMELQKCLKEKIADSVYFQYLPTANDLCRIALTSRNSLIKDHYPEIMSRYRMTLPENHEIFLALRKKNIRKSLRRTLRRLDGKFPDEISIRCFREKSEINRFCREAAEITKQSWQFKIGRGITDNIKTRQLLSILAEQSRFIGFILYLADKPCAFSSGISYNNIYYGEEIGYNTKYKKYSVGMVLILKIIEALCDDPDLEFIDFGPGDVDYKENFCDLKWQVASFHMFPRTVKGSMLSAITRFSGASDKAGKFILNQLKLKNLMKASGVKNQSRQAPNN